VNPLWTYFWPAFAAGLVIGLIAGLVAMRRQNRWRLLSLGAFLALAAAGLWHGPFGGAQRFSAVVEKTARSALDYYEMPAIQAHLHTAPLSRKLILAGQADDFQRSELARLLSQLPGVSSATWENGSGVPLLLEAAGVALLGFLIGLLLAYLVELHRRYNAQWKW
jgi:hypothetical protein